MANGPIRIIKGSTLTIRSVNIRSLISNWNIFLASQAIDADVICLQETWKINNLNMVQLKGFNDLE